LSRKLLVLIATAVALLAIVPAASAAPAPRVTVMTRNLFLGADLIPLATTAPGAPFQQAAGALYDGVVATDPDARMKLVAREIADARPDLVGLQEVSLWRTGAAPASTVVYDYTRTITKELNRLHAHYRVVGLKRGFNVEGPTDRGFDIRLTLGDAILVRNGVKVSHVRSGAFKNQLIIPTQAIGPVPVTRGWDSLDAKVGGARLHFVNTHLEAYSQPVRLEQAKELVAGPLKSKLQTVLAGDLNSGPDLSDAGDRPPYLAIAKAGFKPLRSKKSSCCFDDLKGDAGWDHNVDWIMGKGGPRLVASSIVGREKTKSGNHPSDHGGVISILKLKR
jgi:endonuclease/exonuclease/phosphatase family metal-dependent hydrolase